VTHPAPLAAPTGLFLGDNGRLFCARFECAGATAHATGRDLSGQRADALSTLDLAALERDTGLIPRCEGCNRDAEEIAAASVNPAVTRARCEIPGCENTPRRYYKICNTHRTRIQKYGDPHYVKRIIGKPLLRFLRQVRIESADACWLWTGKITSEGYGTLSVDGEVRLVHRWIYEQTRGKIPSPLQPDHLCRVRHCANPSHLELVTSAENTRRGARTRLTESDVSEIRRLLADGEPQTALAKRFNVSSSHVSKIARGVKWR